jgi:hypothetical protein
MQRKLTIVLRSILGFIFVAGPLAAVFHVGEPALPPDAAAFAVALAKTGYMMPLLWSTEILAGVLLLSGILVPVALLLLAPLIVNIAAFHAFLAPGQFAPAVVVVVLELFLAWQYRDAFKPLFSARAIVHAQRQGATLETRTA